MSNFLLFILKILNKKLLKPSLHCLMGGWTPLESHQWSQIWDTVAHGSINSSFLEANYKLMLRWYMVPSRLVTFNRGTLDCCFWGFGSAGTCVVGVSQDKKTQGAGISTHVYGLDASISKNSSEELLNAKSAQCTANQFRLISFIFTAAKQTS